MKFKIFPFGIFCFLLLTCQYFRAQNKNNVTYDVLIKNARVFDGSLKQAFQADVAIKDDIIAKVARSIKEEARRVINAEGFYVSPGFIDLHTHVDEGMYFPENRSCLNYLKQGVTTVIVGQCGSSAWPIFEKAEDQIKRWTAEGIGPNAALLVGHGTVRQIVMGMDNRAPSPEELEQMKFLVKEAMEQGAYGFSTGLTYFPGIYGKTDEIIELAKVIAPFHGIYFTHVRNERDKLVESVREAIEIADSAGIPAHISHFKVMDKKNWGLVRKACAIIEEARNNNLKITADQYPYRFGGNYPSQELIPNSTWVGKKNDEKSASADVDEILGQLRDAQLIEMYKETTPYIPINDHHERFLNSLSRKQLVQFVGRTLTSFSRSRGPENERERMLFLRRMSDPEEAKKIYREIDEYLDNIAGPENYLVWICVDKNHEGKTLKEVAAMKKISIAEAAVELELMGAKCIPLQMCEDDIEYIMKKDYVATGSDGIAPYYGIGLPHIRSYSTFLHKFKQYVFQRKAVSLPHAIRSQTSLAAQIMNFDDRGRIEEGYKADVVVLDLENIKNKTSVSNPHQYSTGVKYLLINGVIVIDQGEWNGKLPGKILKPKKS